MPTPEIVLRRLAAIAIVAVGTAAVVASDSDAVRYTGIGNSRLCAAQQMAAIPSDADTDVLLMGSSRVRRGLTAETIMLESGSTIRSVYNLARPGRGMLRNVIMLRDLLERGVRPKLVVVEVPIADYRSRQEDTGPLLRLLNVSFLRWSDIPYGTSIWGVPANLPFAKEGNIVLGKLSMSLELMLDGTVASVLTTPAGPPERVCFQARFDRVRAREEREKTALLEAALAKTPNYSTALEDRDMRFDTERVLAELRSLATLREYAEKYQFRLILTRIPAFTELPYSERVKAEVLRVMPEFRFPPDALYRLDQSHFIDNNHLSPAGRHLMSEWLAGLAIVETVGR